MYIKRDAEERVLESIREYPITFVVGPRRAGKTTMAKHIAEKIGARYAGIDDPELLEVFNANIKEFSKRFMGDITVVDEIQYGKDAGLKLKYLADHGGKKIIATGSSARAISAEVIAYLVGRTNWITLWPFSLKEIARARIGEDEPVTPEWERFSREYVLNGGFPEVVLSERPEKRLSKLTKQLVFKELPLLEGVDATSAWNVAEAIALSGGGPQTVASVAKAADLQYWTAKKITNALEEAFIIKRIRPFFGKKRLKELRKAPKIYFTDPGMYRIIAGREKPDGISFETAVLAEILKNEYEPYYWRTSDGAEVDFVIKRGQRIVAVEAKMNWPAGRIPRGLRSFIDAYEPEKALIVDLKAEEWEEKVGKTVVKKIPVWKIEEELHEKRNKDTKDP